MTRLWCVHVKANLLHRIRDIRPSEHQVLWRVGHAPIPRGIADKLTVAARCLGLGVGGGWCWLAVEHACTLEDVVGIGGLREGEAIRCALHVDAEEVADRTKILDSERGPEVGDDLGDECAALLEAVRIMSST